MIKIICVGKIKENYLKEAIEDYTKRISKYTKIEIIEVLDEKIEEKAILNESIKIEKHIKENDYLISLDIDGNNLSSVQLADKIEKMFINYPNITFIIGGSYGLSDTIKNKSYRLSFSNMTFPHQLFRVMLLEQIYRSFKIINNETYHK